MPPQLTANGPSAVVVVGVAILVWYVYQIGSRKKEEVLYKFRRMIVALVLYIIAAFVLLKQGLPAAEAVALSVLAGFGIAWLLVKPPKRDRRIPKATRRQVIARDLTSKGIKWDSSKHHIDHIVPYSRGGDHSPKNLRVMEKEKNLRKGGKMPGFLDFLR